MIVKSELYFGGFNDRPSPHNGTYFAASVRSSLLHVSLLSPHISLFDCIWLLLLTILKYSLIQVYVTFQSHHVVFVDVPLSHC